MKKTKTEAVYRQLLGENFSRLPDVIQKLHNNCSDVTYSGECQVTRGNGLLAKLVGAVMRFPPATDHSKISVRFISDGKTEQWIRYFGNHRFSSTQWIGNNLLYEKIGVLTIEFHVTANNQGLSLNIRKIYLGILPLPAFLYPRIIARESSGNSRFCFYIKADMPFIGFIVEYKGWLSVNR